MTPHPRNQSQGRGAIKAVGALLVAATALSGCGGKDAGTPGVVGSVRGFLGGATSDEPRVALVARDVLSAGGNAVDAAVAAAFTLTVAYPSQVPLGGGGMCLVASGSPKAREEMYRMIPSEIRGQMEERGRGRIGGDEWIVFTRRGV